MRTPLLAVLVFSLSMTSLFPSSDADQDFDLVIQQDEEELEMGFAARIKRYAGRHKIELAVSAAILSVFAIGGVFCIGVLSLAKRRDDESEARERAREAARKMTALKAREDSSSEGSSKSPSPRISSKAASTKETIEYVLNVMEQQREKPQGSSSTSSSTLRDLGSSLESKEESPKHESPREEKQETVGSMTERLDTFFLEDISTLFGKLALQNRYFFGLDLEKGINLEALQALDQRKEHILELLKEHGVTLTLAGYESPAEYLDDLRQEAVEKLYWPDFIIHLFRDGKEEEAIKELARFVLSRTERSLPSGGWSEFLRVGFYDEKSKALELLGEAACRASEKQNPSEKKLDNFDRKARPKLNKLMFEAAIGDDAATFVIKELAEHDADYKKLLAEKQHIEVDNALTTLFAEHLFQRKQSEELIRESIAKVSLSSEQAAVVLEGIELLNKEVSDRLREDRRILREYYPRKIKCLSNYVSDNLERMKKVLEIIAIVGQYEAGEPEVEGYESPSEDVFVNETESEEESEGEGDE